MGYVSTSNGNKQLGLIMPLVPILDSKSQIGTYIF